MVLRFLTASFHMQVPVGLARSDSEKAEVLSDSSETQFQPVKYLSEAAYIETVNEELHTYESGPKSEPKLRSPSVAVQVIRGLELERLRARTVFRTGS